MMKSLRETQLLKQTVTKQTIQLKFNLNKEINELREEPQGQFNQLEKNKRLIEDQNKELFLLNNKKR